MAKQKDSKPATDQTIRREKKMYGMVIPPRVEAVDPKKKKKK